MGARRRQPPEHRAALRARRLLRASGIVVVSLFIAAVTLDHLGCFGYRGNDHANFDGKPFVIDHVSEDGSLVLRDKPMTAVTLLGVSMPGKKLAVNEARGYFERAVVGKPVILKLDPLETRDAEGRLWAYVFLTDNDVLNVDIVRDGLAYADTRQKTSLRASIGSAETDARKHNRGVWSEVRNTGKTADP